MVTASGVTSLAGLLGAQAPSSVRAMIGDWDGWCDRIADALTTPGSAPVFTAAEEVVFLAPLPDPSNLYLAGANYYDHIAEMKAHIPDKSVEDVFHFMIPSASLVGTGHDVIRPRGMAKLDWEVELAVVIGRRADAVKVDEALSYVAGYTVANDVSGRDAAIIHPIFGVRFLYAKGQATLTPMGPAIVPARFVPDPEHLTLSTRVNGEVKQDSNTSKMIWSVAEQISLLSAQAPLLPGDIILTGTPAGTAAAQGTYLTDGDVMILEVEGLGVLTNRVVATR